MIKKTKSIESIKNYLEVFSRKDSVSCSSHWQYPSSLICDSQSSVFSLHRMIVLNTTQNSFLLNTYEI